MNAKPKKNKSSAAIAKITKITTVMIPELTYIASDSRES